jgi:hypothetical protein
MPKKKAKAKTAIYPPKKGMPYMVVTVSPGGVTATAVESKDEARILASKKRSRFWSRTIAKTLIPLNRRRRPKVRHTFPNLGQAIPAASEQSGPRSFYVWAIKRSEEVGVLWRLPQRVPPSSACLRTARAGFSIAQR